MPKVFVRTLKLEKNKNNQTYLYCDAQFYHFAKIMYIKSII